MFIIKAWNYLSLNGVRPDHNFTEAARIRVLNRLCIIAVVLSFSFLFPLLYFSAPILSIIIEISAAISSVTAFLLVRKNMLTAGSFIIFLSLPFGMMLMNLAVGKTGVEYFFFSAFILSFYIFSNPWHIRFLAVYLFILFVFSKYFEQTIDVPAQFVPIQPFIYYSNIFITFLIGYVFHRLFVMEHERNRREIESKNDLLEKSSELTLKKNEEIKTLLKELSHRTKNNLQLVSSLINIQASKVADDKAKKALLDSKNRIISIALLHKKLYQNDNFMTLSFKEYVDDLILHLSNIYEDKILHSQIITEIDDFDIKIDNAVTLGLIINELLTNAFNHGLSNSEENNKFIKIKIIKLPDNMIELKISDSGDGIEKLLEEKETKSFGISLIKSLVKQMDGSIRFAENSENSVRIVLSTNR
jgi:two-component sensor histidine kinase